MVLAEIGRADWPASPAAGGRIAVFCSWDA
jgi:hypothetical protein